MKQVASTFFLVIAMSCFGQDIKTFYDTRVVNGHSVEVNQKRALKFIIAHRFGMLSSGGTFLWGLDDSQIRLGLDYGITNDLTVGLGRSSNDKVYDGFAKYKLIRQTDGMPLSIVAFGSLSYRSKIFDNPALSEVLNVSHRMMYVGQLLMGRKFSDRVSVQLMPTFLHRNLKINDGEGNLVYSTGIAARYKLFKRLTLSVEYYNTPKFQVREVNRNSLSIGFNIETKGHVFQLHLGNSRGMIEQYFVTETFGSWADANMGLGFNITRDFKL